MKVQNDELNFSGQVVYVGIDVGKKNWAVSMYVADREHRVRSLDPSAEVLRRYLHAHFPGARYRCVYEAGYFGFAPFAALQAAGLECIVVNPGDVPTMNKERVRKTDVVDARKLAREFASGKLKGIHVPSRVEQEDRSLARSREMTVRKQTRCKNQIKALLGFYGIIVDEEVGDRYWSRKYITWLQQLNLATPAGTDSLQLLVKELLFFRSQILDITRRIRALSRDARYCESLKFLLTAPGFGMVNSMTFLTEIGDIRRFKNENRLATFVGLVPGEHSSSDTVRTTGMTPRRNTWLRHILIEAAWIASAKDTDLLNRYRLLKNRMPASKAIVRIARNLLRRIRYVLLNRVPYAMAAEQ